MIRAIIFDIDNTLIDFWRMKKHCISRAVDAMIKAGLRASKEHAIKWIYNFYEKHGYEYQYVFQRFLKNINKEIDFKILATGIIAYRKARVDKFFTYKNVKKTLKKLKKRGLKLCVVSDAPKLNAYGRLVSVGIADYFDFVVAFEDTKKHKPHSLPFAKAIERLNVKPEEILMVGDRLERDILGAKKMGMKSCLAKYGHAREEKTDVRPDYEINEFSELLKIIEQNVYK